jgi:hypothetical protein
MFCFDREKSVTVNLRKIAGARRGSELSILVIIQKTPLIWNETKPIIVISRGEKPIIATINSLLLWRG